jgi:hypothetical protein
MPTAPEPLEFALDLRWSNYVKNVFIECIRVSFAHESTPEAYRYHLTDPKKRQLSIYRSFPKRQTKLPAILVETDSGNFSISTVGDEEGYEDNDGNIVYTGTMEIPVKLTILAKTATDREKLTDLLSIYVRFVFRQLLYKANVPYLDIRSGEAGEETVDGEVIYKGEVTVQCQTEFKQKIDYSMIEAVGAINLQGVLYGSSDADLQPNTSTGS